MGVYCEKAGCPKAEMTIIITGINLKQVEVNFMFDWILSVKVILKISNKMYSIYSIIDFPLLGW